MHNFIHQLTGRCLTNKIGIVLLACASVFNQVITINDFKLI